MRGLLPRPPGQHCFMSIYELGDKWVVMGGRNHWLGMWRVPAWGELERQGVFQMGLDKDSSHFS